ncbi:MAG: hypothetical protein Q8N55_02225 [bacterium]|nr:hypothetical protein [bacterium]
MSFLKEMKAKRFLVLAILFFIAYELFGSKYVWMADYPKLKEILLEDGSTYLMPQVGIELPIAVILSVISVACYVIWFLRNRELLDH